MPVREIAGVQIDLNDEGYMTNSDQWNEEIAKVLATEEGLSELTEDHMHAKRRWICFISQWMILSLR